MARIDRILSIVLDQGANELRLGTDREPKMLAYGAVKRLSIPLTNEDTLRDLLGDILTPEREEAMRARGRVDATYDAGELGAYQVTLTSRADGFDIVFRKTAARGAAPLPSEARAPSSAHLAVAPASSREAREGRDARDEPAPTPTIDGETIDASPALVQLVAHAAERRASDLHLAEGDPPVVRIDGRLTRLDQAPVILAELLPLGANAEARLARHASLDLGVEVPGVGRVRVHVFRSDTGRAAAIRLLPRTAPSLAGLNLPVPLDDLIELPHGLVLVCGAAGSGKSTTLAALAQEALRRRSIVLTTLEDPIEYALAAEERSIVRRRQIGRDVPDFATGLRDALRQDPDVLLIGEMRDPETINLALTAAETGHLVLASLHSRSAASAVERIVDAYAPERAAQIRLQLADALRAVVAQRLLPRARGAGRVVAVEVLRGTHAVASLVREGKTAQIPSAIQSGRREGMITLERCLADRVIAGEVRAEDARAAANDPSALAMHLPK
ncbi:MAG: PilT/PilU family type 4a pilus ATPase [Labilithrix sp.]|nr:PilT/PilU family type 4a pilus ATPase [Labilithrix sp.]